MKTQEVLAADVIDEQAARAVEESFRTRPMPSGQITAREIVRRVELVKEIFAVLQNEAGWSEQRIVDHLPAFLARGLDGLDSVPAWAQRRMGEGESVMWGSEAAGRVEPESRLSALSKVGDGRPLVVVPKGAKR